MPRTKNILSMLGTLAPLVVVSLACGQAPRGQGMRFPTTGKEAPGLAPLDDAVMAMMRRHGIPGASLAVAKDGKLVFARGYGWAVLEARTPVQPDTVFGLASLSKSITALATLKLVEQGKLSLEGRVFKILNTEPLAAVRVDPRLYQITIRQLLNHSGGWDRQVSGDPVNWTTQVKMKYGPQTAISPRHLIAFTMGEPLDFDPGTECRYCNFGYLLLGEVIARVSGQSYEKFVRDNVLIPMGLRNVAVPPGNGTYAPNQARRYLSGATRELPGWEQSYLNAVGGWTASAVDLARLLTAVDGSRGKRFLSDKMFAEMIAPPPPPLKPKADGSYVGLGWDIVNRRDKAFTYFKDGSWYGMRCFMKRLPSGINWVLMFNASMDPDVFDRQAVLEAAKEVREAVERMERFPNIDLFEEYR